jgi:hypothetical protein
MIDEAPRKSNNFSWEEDLLRQETGKRILEQLKMKLYLREDLYANIIVINTTISVIMNELESLIKDCNPAKEGKNLDQIEEICQEFLGNFLWFDDIETEKLFLFFLVHTLRLPPSNCVRRIFTWEKDNVYFTDACSVEEALTNTRSKDPYIFKVVV